MKSRRGRAGLSRARARGSALVIALFLSACHPTPRPVATPRLSAVQQLQHDIDAILAAPALEHSDWGVFVKSLASTDEEETLYTPHARTRLMAAANMKIATLAAASARLGWDFHYDTRLVADGPIQG